MAVLALLVCMIPTAYAASASLSGPGTVRAGDTITLSFYAGGGIYGGSGTMVYDSSLLTLQGYTASIGGSWAVEFSGDNFVFYDNSMTSPLDGTTIFTATFTVNGGLVPGTVIAVTAAGVTLSDGTQDIGAGSPTYSIALAEPLSGDCNLATMAVSNATISPAFSADVTNYAASVPFSVSSIGVNAGAAHPNATVSVSNPQLVPGGTTIVSVTVTAENGAVKTYTIRVAREQDPNYVESDNADLQALSVENFPISPAFSPDVTQYYVWLPYEVDAVSIRAEKADSKASFQIADDAELIPGKGTDLAVTVTAENDSQKVYTVTAVRAPAHEDTQAFLEGQREQEIPEPVEKIVEVPVEVPVEVEVEVEKIVEVPAGLPSWATILIGIGSLAVGAVLSAVVVPAIRKKKEQ